MILNENPKIHDKFAYSKFELLKKEIKVHI